MSIFEPATGFNFNPADFAPFKDKEVCERVRKISGTDLEKREAWWHPEFIGSGDIEEWLNQPAKLVTLHPMTILQNSLNGTFGQSGDIANVPPKAATIGPIDVMRAKERIEVHALATNGTFSSWQRMTSRLVTHGPVTPYVPSSMLQTKKTQVYISEELAAPFECWEKVGY